MLGQLPEKPTRSGGPTPLDLVSLVNQPVQKEHFSLHGPPGTWISINNEERRALQGMHDSISSQIQELKTDFDTEFHDFSWDSVDQKVTPAIRRVFLQNILLHLSEVLLDRDINPETYWIGDMQYEINEALAVKWLHPAVDYRETLLGKSPKHMWVNREKWKPSLGTQAIGIEAVPTATQSDDRRVIEGIIRVAAGGGKGLKFMDKLSQVALGIRWFMKNSEDERVEFMK